MQKIIHITMVSLSALMLSNTLISMDSSSTQELPIVSKIEAYLKNNPEYVPQKGFVTGFITDESDDIVHASVQPDLTKTFHLQNGSLHPASVQYAAKVVPTSNIHEAHKDHRCMRFHCSTYKSLPADQLAIFASCKVPGGIIDSSKPQKCIAYEPALSSLGSKGITAACISFEAAKLLIGANYNNTDNVVALLQLARDVIKGSKRGAMLTSDGKTLNSLDHILYRLEKYGSWDTLPRFSLEVYPKPGKTMAQLIYDEIDSVEECNQALPFERATLAVSKDMKSLFAYIKKSEASKSDACPSAGQANMDLKKLQSPKYMKSLQWFGKE